MWYFIWFLAILLASCLAVITGIWVDRKEDENKN